MFICKKAQTGIYKDFDFDGQTYKAYTPNPLSSHFPVPTDEETSYKLIMAARAFQRLDITLQNINYPNAYEKNLTMREALLSCRIEGCNARLFDVFDPIPESNPSLSVPFVFDYINALNYIRDNINTDNLDCGFIKTLNAFLCGNKDDHSFRDKYSWDGIKAHPDVNGYIAPLPGDVAALMEEITSFISSVNYDNAIIKSIMVYYQTLVIRPFNSASNRTARLVFLAALIKFGLVKTTAFCLSDSLLKNDYLLYNLSEDTIFTGNFPYLVKTYVNMLLKSLYKTIDMIEHMDNAYHENLDRILHMGGTIKSSLKLFEYIQSVPVFELSRAAAAMDVSYTAVSGAVSKLGSMGIIKPFSKRRRAVFYAYSDIVDTLDIENV